MAEVEGIDPVSMRRTDEIDSLFAQTGADIAAIRADVEKILVPLIDTLKRNRYFDELQDQLRKAERVAQAWRDWPLIVGVHDAVLTLRQSPTPDKHVLEHLENLLFQADVTEYGLAGECIDPEQVEVVASRGTGQMLVVEICRRPGLKVGSLPLRKAIVEITRSERNLS